MFVERNARSPHFTAEELTEIFRSARSHTTRSVQAAARKLYPDREEDAYEGLYLSRGPGRAFRNSEGRYESPKYNLVSWPVAVAVLESGEVLPF
jgi:hypothetical protein